MGFCQCVLDFRYKQRARSIGMRVGGGERRGESKYVLLLSPSPLDQGLDLAVFLC